MSLLKKLSLTAWIFIALVAGILIGVFFPAFAVQLAPISNIFLRLIKSIVGPLLFGTLIYGISSAGELKTMGRIALKAITYFEVATTLALVIGLVTVNLFQPGAGIKINAGNGRRPADSRQTRFSRPGAGTCRSHQHFRIAHFERRAADGRFLFPFRRGLFSHRQESATGG